MNKDTNSQVSNHTEDEANDMVDNGIEDKELFYLADWIELDMGSEEIRLIKEYADKRVQQERDEIVFWINKNRTAGMTIVRDTGSEFMTPRMKHAVGYDDAMVDLVAYITNKSNE